MNGWDGGPAGEMAERNREIIAERLGYPEGTVEAERLVEAECPEYFCWYSKGGMAGQPGPHYGARLRHARYCDPDYYADSPEALIAKIQAGERP